MQSKALTALDLDVGGMSTIDPGSSVFKFVNSFNHLKMAGLKHGTQRLLLNSSTKPKLNGKSETVLGFVGIQM
jgi:hypothetical protein